MTDRQTASSRNKSKRIEKQIKKYLKDAEKQGRITKIQKQTKTD